MNLRFNKYLLLFSLFLITINSNAFSQVRFAAIGDYGLAVANLVKSWNPDFISTLGDNNYQLGADSTIDENIGQYYHEFIYPYTGRYGVGSSCNKFFPALGNHDWISDSAQPYFDYFELPGNERYYDFIWGNVHLFAIDSDTNEQDGVNDSSAQAMWLKNALLCSQEKWNIVYFHHAPYSSGPHGSTVYMQWSFKEWGADLILSGHDHDYERLVVDSLTYIVNGLGGKSIYTFIDTLEQSIFRYSDNYGALIIEADENNLSYKFYNIDGTLIDPVIVSNQESENLLLEFQLSQNYPNPFNPSTSILYRVSRISHINIKVYDVLGNEVATLVNEEKPAGKYEVGFTENNLTSGVYFYSLRAGNFTQTKKMILLK
ncbi:MAG: metallophosphoesterase [Ignavibacteria bacterium]|nr:metallophosphoesterase [Ignavibacteria bacterium]